MSTVTGGQGNIVTNGLVLNLDAANPRSYPQPYNGTAWRNLVTVSSSISGSLVNGAIYTGSNGGTIVFDGVNDFSSTNYNIALTDFTVCMWFKTPDSTNDASDRLIDKNYVTGMWLGKNTTAASNSWGGGIRESSPPIRNIFNFNRWPMAFLDINKIRNYPHFIWRWNIQHYQ